MKLSSRTETDRERLLLCYQTNQQIVQGRLVIRKKYIEKTVHIIIIVAFQTWHDHSKPEPYFTKY